jgi:hypothetical protein
MIMPSYKQIGFAIVLIGFSLGTIAIGPAAQVKNGKVKVHIQDDKPTIVEAVLPLDPTKYVQYQAAGLGVVVRVENKTMHLGAISPIFKIDEQVLFPGQVVIQNQRLAKTAAGKERDGVMSVFAAGKIRITQTIEVVPSKPVKPVPGQKRRLDTVLVRYTAENTDSVPHRVGMRIFLDVYVVDNDGALFAAPTMPDKILNGVELKDEPGKKKMVPDYLQILQRPNLKDPGFVAHFTYNLGKSSDMPDRVVCTRLGAGGDNWNVNALPAGDSALAFFWEPKEVKAGGKREMAYAYGQGIATSPENEGRVTLHLTGSFEPGKVFSIAAHVDDPPAGQALRLELPDGMERVEGKETQPVPASFEDHPSVVVWKARVLRHGEFPLRVHSTNGVTQIKLISITPAH